MTNTQKEIFKMMVIKVNNEVMDVEEMNTDAYGNPRIKVTPRSGSIGYVHGARNNRKAGNWIIQSWPGVKQTLTNVFGNYEEL